MSLLTSVMEVSRGRRFSSEAASVAPAKPPPRMTMRVSVMSLFSPAWHSFWIPACAGMTNCFYALHVGVFYSTGLEAEDVLAAAVIAQAFIEGQHVSTDDHFGQQRVVGDVVVLADECDAGVARQAFLQRGCEGGAGKAAAEDDDAGVSH